MVGDEGDAVAAATELPVEASCGGIAFEGEEDRVAGVVRACRHCAFEELHAVSFGEASLTGVGRARQTVADQ